MSDPKNETHILFTNISSVSFGDVRLHCHALVLSQDYIMGERIQLRGFATEACTEVFDFRLKSQGYELEDTTHSQYRTDERFFKNGHRLYSSYKLTLVNGVELSLFTDESEFELDVQKFEGDRDSRVILDVWEALARKTERYWSAPAIPMSVPVPPAQRLSMQKQLMPGLFNR